MSCGLRNECTQENCHRCEMSEDGRTMFVQSEKFFNFDAVIEIEKKNSYRQGKVDANDEFAKSVLAELNKIAEDDGYSFNKDHLNLVSSVMYLQIEMLKENKND